MGVLVWGHGTLNIQRALCVQVYSSNTIIITIMMKILIPSCQVENIFSPHFCIKMS